MSQTVSALSNAEAIDSERDLVRGAVSPLCTASGFVFGGLLSGTFWTMAGLLVWCLA